MSDASAGLSLVAAATVGLLGSLHCVGMCGGIVGAFSYGLESGQSRRARWLHQLAYNAGRIVSYALAGALMGALGALLAASLEDLLQVARLGRMFAAVFMIGLGLYLLGWTRILLPLERAGAGLWRRIEPFGRRLLPIRSPWQSLLFGLVWGWLPCGMVYSVLVLALSSADPAQGFSIMLAFGIGTLPMLLALGAGAGWLLVATRNPWVRRGAGLSIVIFGLTGLLAPFHGGHGRSSEPMHGFSAAPPMPALATRAPLKPAAIEQNLST